MLTVHQLLLFQSDGEGLVVPLKMESKDVEPSATVVALDCQRPGLVLHGEIIAHCTGTISDEAVRLGKAFLDDQLMKEIVQCSLIE